MSSGKDWETFTYASYQDFKRAYESAVAARHAMFTWHGHDFYTVYAKLPA